MNEIKKVFEKGKSMWDETYLQLEKSLKIWRIVSVLLLIITAISVLGALYFANNGKTKFVYIEVDQLGNSRQLKTNATYTPSQKIIDAFLRNYIRALRSVSTDREVRNQNIDKITNWTNRQSKAWGRIEEFITNNNPHKISKDKSIHIKHHREPLKITENTYSLKWQEITRNKEGVLISKNNYEGTVTLEHFGNLEEEYNIKNPLQRYVIEVNWNVFKK